MSKADVFESDFLKLVFQNLAIANIGNAGGLLPSSVPGNLFVALHTADPGEAGNQNTSEATYTGYARVAVVRSAVGWTVAGTAPTAVTNAGAVPFPACTAGSSLCTHFSVGTLTSGAGQLLYKGPLSASLSVSVNITPSFAIGQISITED